MLREVGGGKVRMEEAKAIGGKGEGARVVMAMEEEKLVATEREAGREVGSERGNFGNLPRSGGSADLFLLCA